MAADHEKKLSVQLMDWLAHSMIVGAKVEAVSLHERGICLHFDNGYDLIIPERWTLRMTQEAIEASRAAFFAENGGVRQIQ